MRYINAPLVLEYDVDGGSVEFKHEYDSLSSVDDDSIGEWLRIAKARGATEDSDQILLSLVVELHRKMDEMNAFMRGERRSFLTLTCKGDIEAINHEYFRLKEGLFREGEEYYGRIEMPFFPKRKVPIYFKAISKNEASIVLLHERDVSDWSAYVVARERVMIREMKASRDGN